MTVSKFTKRAQISYIIEEILTLLQYSIEKEEELEIYRTNLMTLNNIEYVKIELRKALVQTDAYDRIFDNTTHFNIQSERSESIDRAAKLIVLHVDLEKDI